MKTCSKKFRGLGQLNAIGCLPLLWLSLSFPAAAKEEKKLLVPEGVWRVPVDNDYKSPSSEYSFERMVESPNFAIIWSKEFGPDPAESDDPKRRLPLSEIVSECERFHACYVNELGFTGGKDSVVHDHKLLVYVLGGDEGTAFGGGEEEVGILWTPQSRTANMPFGALAHELGHSFQYLVHADGAWAFGFSSDEGGCGAFFEMTSQFMLWQVYPEWMTFENYHLVDFLKKTHYAFLHETNQYHSPYVLEYWAMNHGRDFIGRLWHGSEKGEDPVMTYKRMTGIDQEAFNDEMFDASRRFITWDLERIANVASRYAHLHTSEFDPRPDGWFRIAESRCPQNYGYNGIRLTVPTAGTTVKLEFKGIAGADGFRSIRSDDAGWRYGFLAAQDDDSRVYGEIHRAAEGVAEFVVPERTTHLWLVVSGAPKQHWKHVADGQQANDEQWPYKIRLTGTTLDPSTIRSSP